MTYKKTLIHPKIDGKKCLLFQNKPSPYQANGVDIVYLDESGFAHDMPRTHGYALKGQWCYGTQDWGARGHVKIQLNLNLSTKGRQFLSHATGAG